MKKLLITVITALVSSVAIHAWVGEKEDISVAPESSPWDSLIEALIEVESKGNPDAVGGAGARGILQITPVCVAEANRLSGKEFSHDDAWDPDKSREIFHIMADHYCPEVNFEKMARIWNGGPRGHLKDQTLAYWNKVQKYL